jgi:hypothetical protein
MTTTTIDHRGCEDREAEPAVVVSGSVDVVEIVEQPGGEYQGHVHHDENEEPDQQEMQRSCLLDA